MHANAYAYSAIGIRAVVLIEVVLDAHCGVDRVRDRSEGRHEAVAKEEHLLATMLGDLAANDRLVDAEDLVGDLVAAPVPELCRTLDVGEEDREPLFGRLGTGRGGRGVCRCAGRCECPLTRRCRAAPILVQERAIRAFGEGRPANEI